MFAGADGEHRVVPIVRGTYRALNIPLGPVKVFVTPLALAGSKKTKAPGESGASPQRPVEIPKKYSDAETSVLLCYGKLTPRLLVKLDYLVFACHARPMNAFK